MAKAIETDPFKCFRFAPRVGFDGRAMGVSRIEVTPENEWWSRGRISMMSSVKPDVVEFGRIQQKIELVIGVYHQVDDIGSDPSLNIVLSGVHPNRAKMELSPLDAAEDEVFTMKLTMDYDRLTFVFGDSLLEKIAAVV